MNFERQNIEEIILCEPKVFDDDRGYFSESFKHDSFSNFLNREINFRQENESVSHKNVFRGLHFQKNPLPQAKLVRVVKGSIIDIAVDIRPFSKTYCQCVSIELNDKNRKQLFIPHGFAHGFLSLENDTKVIYKVDNYYEPDLDAGVNYKDPKFKLDIDQNNLIISEKDLNLPFLDELKENGDI